ncbi:MAG: NADH:ubiquinone reductase (Na(+)-transporting) subunit C [Candidatus Neomarinimicrobiota bacterium]|nr:NADH:ubiquinone reductase (Na(+)-transporting) subunit C [Candidatus Neomarinimicrobiota bacterium]MEC9436699.1 NADH:ubiquinone reductase (Na(+)-transporting) subunit C [Candidatus Neomarinimicrobiota bacterium]MED5434081.1 NADH:ubiquinone reductase (Na(+)-transporting) subunit C [Candidatus Neomarinimicrobiota bacterium]|tara:strand:- start:611 stop:1330 length:720 start_codon:yes stop_codon:yes gene_type:complete
MHSNRYTLIFTTLVTMILAFILSSAYSSLEDITNSNIQADIKKNILSSLGFAPSNKAPWTTENVEQIFKESIVSFVVDKSGNVIPGKLPQDIDPKVDTELYPLYKKIVDGKVDGFAIPISGKGLWGTMYGYFAIESDGATAKGITFYKHIETPGLGAEVDKPWFQQNFVGKRFIDNDGNLIGIQTIKGKVDESSDEAYHQVDGITGATMTSRGLNEFLLKDLKFYNPYFEQIRKNINRS